jgi:magnesium transporter
LDDFWEVTSKELATSVVVGVAMAVLSAPVLWGIGYASGFVAPAVAITVLVTLALLTVCAATIATAVVFTALSFNLEAATFAPPCTTTLIDAVGLLIYFYTAQVVFSAYGTPL